MKPTDTVWKFSRPLAELNDEISFTMPRNARVLSAVNQREHLTIYASVAPSGDGRSTEVRRFRIQGTGHPFMANPDALFIGTVVFSAGDLVFHVWLL